MKRHLILLRHAKSDWGNPLLADFDRPLNNRGKKDVLKLSLLFQQLDIFPVSVISSPAVRTKATTESILYPLKGKIENIEYNDSLYLSSVAEYIKAIKSTDTDTNNLLIVGHNPTLTDLLNTCTNLNIENMPTACLAIIEYEIESWSELDNNLGKLLMFCTPKSLITV